MGRIIGACVAVALLVIFLFPFARDAYRRYEVENRLNAVMTDHDKEAFQAWSGDPRDFGRALYERCTLTNGPNAAICEPYRTAIQ
jgi:hypothetical protein